MTANAQREEQNLRRRLRRGLRKQINEIVDPCSTAAGAPAGLVDFGLIRGVYLSKADAGRWKVCVRLVLTEPACIMGGPFAMRIRDKLTPLPDVASVEVRIEPVGSWTEADMSPAYRSRLNERRRAQYISLRLKA